MKRFPNWPERLAGMVARAANHPFQLGDHNCCFFAADCMEAMTGIDPAVDLRGCNAARVLKERGVNTLMSEKAELYGMKVIRPMVARRGDICLLNAGYGETLGVCLGANIACPGENGLVFFPLRKALRAWSVG